jgi:glycosyltransferase involved in cell wall biosynthesis
VLDDEVSLLTEPEPGAMARGLVRLLADEGLRERLATNAKDFARRELTLEAYEGKLLRFYAAIEKKIGGGADHGEIAGLEARHQGHR